jgi:hypothetical protein
MIGRYSQVAQKYVIPTLPVVVQPAQVSSNRVTVVVRSLMT